METITQHQRNERKDQLKSATITALITALLFLLIFYYQFVREIPKEEKVTTMLINFGDNRNGNGAEEPANQEGSLASADIYIPEELKTPEPEKTVEKPIETPKPIEKPSEKIITGKSEKSTAVKTEKTEKTEKKTSKSSEASASKSTTSKTSATNNTATKTAQGDGQGTAAIGNLIKGRGAKSGSQGNDGATGNAGDPLGGNGNGDSKIGVDRKLISFIPGTMGRGGEQPPHNCDASGTVNIAYTVDKSGNVTSARRGSGISDPCVVTAAIIWVKKYVKAEKATTNSTGVYKITF